MTTAVRPAHKRVTDAGPSSRYVPAPMALTHRTRPADTFVHAWTQLGAQHFRLQVRLPHDHPFYPPTPDGTYDPLLLVETMRQSSNVVSHAGVGVPLGHHFMLSDLEFSCRPELLRVAAGMATMELDVFVPEIQYSAGRPSRLRCEWALRRAGAVVATGGARARFTDPRVYRRLRNGAQPPLAPVRPGPALSPTLVGRDSPGDVMLSPGEGPQEWLLRADTSHPTLFQRPNDHIPGMLLLEAARQAATVLTGPASFIPAAGLIGFQSYAELTSPCLIRAEVLPAPSSTRVKVTGVQDGKSVFTCLLEKPTATADHI